MLECIDFAFLADRVIPALNRGLDVSLRLIIPAALIGGALGVFTGVTSSAPVGPAAWPTPQ